jgi:hypothetical protein
MANLKKEIEDRLTVNREVLQLFEAEILFDNKVKKYIETKAERVKSDASYDVSNYTVTLTSRDPIEYHIHIKAIVKGVRSMQRERLRKVIYKGAKIEERGGVYFAEVSFLMVHSFEKTIAARLFR